LVRAEQELDLLLQHHIQEILEVIQIFILQEYLIHTPHISVLLAVAVAVDITVQKLVLMVHLVLVVDHQLAVAVLQLQTQILPDKDIQVVPLIPQVNLLLVEVAALAVVEPQQLRLNLDMVEPVIHQV
tara:strand:- start:1326 stop:1709 length:384 start_codon:yes stop_codon:yes gene_type:complete